MLAGPAAGSQWTSWTHCNMTWPDIRYSLRDLFSQRTAAWNEIMHKEHDEFNTTGWRVVPFDIDWNNEFICMTNDEFICMATKLVCPFGDRDGSMEVCMETLQVRNTLMT